MDTKAMADLIDFTPLFQIGFISIAYWFVAIATSVMWGIYGINEENQKTCLKKTGVFVSEFFGSMFGWSSLYLLIDRIMMGHGDNFEIFLGIVAITGIGGYAYRLADWLSKRS
ncbi:MAG: hypothetical protein PHE73_06870 [Sulfurovaceae bacterium]|nr:hypothetical protein [Sulfurovaceae bacterium]